MENSRRYEKFKKKKSKISGHGEIVWKYRGSTPKELIQFFLEKTNFRRGTFHKNQLLSVSHLP